MWKSFQFVFILCEVIVVSWAFNIENRDPYVKKGPDSVANTYFGFSVALHKTSESDSFAVNWLLVGAPKAQNLQPNTNQSGALFKCPITRSDNDCTQVETDGHRANLEGFDYGDDEGDDSTKTVMNPPGLDEIKNGQWLGVTVKSQKPGGAVMVCAHRYIQSPDLSKNHYGQGLCYLLKSDLKINEALQFCKTQPKEKLHQQYGLCQIGTSISFAGDGFALVGAPGPYTWRGTLFAQNIEGEFLERDRNIYKSPLSENTEPLDKYSYLGMSVAGGYFISKNNSMYVSGAPRSLMMGQVFFLERVAGQEELNIHPRILTGEQFASSFGYEILVVDINNDGLDDLLVGAPFYYDDIHGGSVYVYTNLKDCLTDLKNYCPYSVLRGTERSRFGFAMTSIGDINKDGYNDVAIGAPYYEGHGAVYIYLGSSNGLTNEYSQILYKPTLTTFGYSLSGGLDMDKNGYPDLLVGAYESERALLFLTRPIIDIQISIRSIDKDNINVTKKGCSDDPLNRNHTCFSIDSCFQISGENSEPLDVKFEINEVAKFLRVWFKDENHPDRRPDHKTVTVHVTDFKKLHCQNVTVYLKEGVSDILSPIKFDVKYTLEKDQYHSAILNKSSLAQFEATFQKNCGNDDICESHLVLDAHMNLTENENGEYKVDSLSQMFVITANISNSGESAYEAKLFVTHPKTLSFVNVQTKDSQIKCFLKNSGVVCDLGNPFHGETSALLNLRFQITDSPKDSKLNINLKVNSTSKELSPNTESNIVAVLHKVADFIFTGKGTTNLFFGGEVVGESAMRYLEDIGARVTHEYTIDNRGEWDLPSFQVHIKWPYQVRPTANDEEGKWLLYLEELPVVKGVEQSVCIIHNEKAVVNPLDLKHLDNSLSNNEPENLYKDQPLYLSNTSDSKTLRKRRNTAGVAEPIKLTKEGIERNIVVMDCQNNAHCIDIICYIDSLKTHNHLTIDINSRIWNATLVEDYPNVDWVSIKSTGEIINMDASFKVKDVQYSSYVTETLLYPSNIAKFKSLNWWVIGGAIVAGILLLIVLVVILKKCGFFNRKRVSDHTLSGNLVKDESDNLLHDS
ncbi:integrin alpha-PS1-like isoform X2 [Rhynchophorus ferrugineus]|uniref:integrin alpha-PS1-like isoform X2 n=1 Tax=Rhynchophorus ferrugineus TaxID=354439 RepID=UPI003FCC9419